MHRLSPAAATYPGPAAEPARRRWELVAAHRPRLLRLARRRLPTMEDAEDCVQEALIRAACAAHLDEPRLDRYLTTIVVHLCTDHARARVTAHRTLARLRYQDRQPSPEDIVCDRAEASWLRGHLDHQLSTREREVLAARADGLSTRQAADRLDITGKAAEAALTRARARLRSLAEENSVSSEGSPPQRRDTHTTGQPARANHPPPHTANSRSATNPLPPPRPDGFHRDHFPDDVAAVSVCMSRAATSQSPKVIQTASGRVTGMFSQVVGTDTRSTRM